jgi:hypothetical protein
MNATLQRAVAPFRGDQVTPAQPAIFFMHIPKTAGISLRNMIADQLPVEATLSHAHWQGRQARDPNAYQFVTGHVPFSYIRRFVRPPIVMTFLRDPIDRAISHFHFYKSLPPAEVARQKRELGHEAWHDTVEIWKRTKDLEIGDFLVKEPELARRVLGNVQTSYFLDDGIRDASSPLLAGSVLPEDVVRNLHRCNVIGLTERMQESLTLLYHQVGLAPVRQLARANATERRPTVRDISSRTLAALTELTQLDAQLYRLGEELLERRLREFSTEGRLSEPRRRPGLSDGDFTFAQGGYGQGWYPRENYGNRWYAWSGPDREAWIEMAPHSGGDHLLRLRIVHALQPQILAGLEIRVNGEPVRLQVWRRTSVPANIEVEAAVPAGLLEEHSGRARISINVPEVVRPCDLDPANPDKRELGVAVDRIQLLPVPLAVKPSGPRYFLDGREVARLELLLEGICGPRGLTDRVLSLARRLVSACFFGETRSVQAEPEYAVLSAALKTADTDENETESGSVSSEFAAVRYTLRGQ